MTCRLAFLLAITWTLLAPLAGAIIPQPQQISHSEQGLSLAPTLRIEAQPGLEALAAKIKIWLGEQAPAAKNTDLSAISQLQLKLDSSGTLPAEGYQLEISAKAITLTGADQAGVFYACQSLKQLLRASSGCLQAQRIVDFPRYRWRGMHLDVSRHFYPVDEIKRFLDHMAAYKLNVFHWHLVDGPGWRLEIKRYPKLTEIGAWRKDLTQQPWNWPATQINPQGRQRGDYGGFYTQDQIREIITYAQERYITIVPEIEMPGHSYAALVAHPEFSCPTNQVLSEGLRGKDVFCLGNPASTEFLQHILEEVIELFPSPYIHIGADEVPKSALLECPKCTGLMKEQDLADGDALQSHFVRQMHTFLADRGRKLIGWDEIIAGDLPEEATVMVWRDTRYARSALQQGHPIVLCPNSHCYFDYYQTRDHASVPPAIGGFTPTSKVYQFQPEALATSPAQSQLILGIQGNVWTEYIQNRQQLELRLFPRLAALAEVAWTQPKGRDYQSFQNRLKSHQAHWKKAGIHFYPGPLDGELPSE